MSEQWKLVRTDRPARGLFVRMFDAVRALVINPMNPKDPEIARMFGTELQTSAGVPISEFTALTQSAVWAAVNLISSTTAALPLMPFRYLSGATTNPNEASRKVNLKMMLMRS